MASIVVHVPPRYHFNWGIMHESLLQVVYQCALQAIRLQIGGQKYSSMAVTVRMHWDRHFLHNCAAFTPQLLSGFPDHLVNIHF